MRASSIFFLLVSIFYGSTTYGQIIQRDSLPVLFLEFNDSAPQVIRISDYFEEANNQPLELSIVKKSPGVIFSLVNNEELRIYPSPNFCGQSQLELSFSHANQPLVQTLTCHTQLPEDFHTSCSYKVVNVGVFNVDPIMPQYGNVPAHEAYNWNDPIALTERYFEAIHEVSGGYIILNLTHWQDIREWGIKTDAFQYDAQSFDDCIRNGNCHDPDNLDYPNFITQYRIDSLVNKGYIEEAWLWGGPYFGYWEAAMAGENAYYVNGGVYPEVPSQRPFVILGFNYERGLAEMLHSNGHRTENHLSRAYGGNWNIEDPVSPWDFFTSNVGQSNGTPGVGSIHYPANGLGDYDYANTQTVLSRALDYQNYPNLTGATTEVNRDTWGGTDYHLNYMKWWFDLLPASEGVSSDGRMNNWWKYIYNFTNYDTQGASSNIPSVLSPVDLDFTFSTEPHTWRYLFDLEDYLSDTPASFPTLYSSKPFLIKGKSVYFYDSGKGGTFEGRVLGCDQEQEILLPIRVEVDGLTSTSIVKSFDKTYSLYPNPSNGHILLEWTAEKSSRVNFTLFNQWGQRMGIYPVQVKPGSNILSVEVQAFPKGIYLLKEDSHFIGRILISDAP